VSNRKNKERRSFDSIILTARHYAAYLVLHIYLGGGWFVGGVGGGCGWRYSSPIMHRVSHLPLSLRLERLIDIGYLSRGICHLWLSEKSMANAGQFTNAWEQSSLNGGDSICIGLF